MTPTDLLVGALIGLLVAPLGLRILGHQIQGSKCLHIKITLVPPSIDIRVEHRSD